MNQSSCTNQCPPGMNECYGNSVKICDSVNGCLQWSTLQLCEPSQFCENGECKDCPCTSGDAYCHLNDVYKCDQDCKTEMLLQDCTENELCQYHYCFCPNMICGGICCSFDQVCHDNACCKPDCSGKECGDDGCGGSCGKCEGESKCENNKCV